MLLLLLILTVLCFVWGGILDSASLMGAAIGFAFWSGVYYATT